MVGYRLHTLTAIDAETGHSFPLVSLLAPANHHDSHFLPFLVRLAQAMGIELQLITADEAYHDKDGSLFEETGHSRQVKRYTAITTLLISPRRQTST